MHLIFFVLYNLRFSHPGGSPSCSVAGPVLPFPPELDGDFQDAIGLECASTGVCRLFMKDVAYQFRGFVISVPPPTTIDVFESSKSKRLNGDQCLTHSDNSPKSETTFTLGVGGGGDVVIHVTVVSGYKNQKHTYGAFSATLTFFTGEMPDYGGHVYIIGAGSGGLGAARYLSSVGYDNFTVYERGPHLPADFFLRGINDTYYTATAGDHLIFNPLGSDGQYVLGQGVGGTQNINGAVYAPGTAEEFADSVGVSVDSAIEAMALAASFVEHTAYGMMWACIDETDCDSKTLAYTNSKMARRSIAYNLSDHTLARLVVNTTVSGVFSDRIEIAGGAVINLGVNDSVILAAGALSSPQLLGKTTFSSHNHYYGVDSLIVDTDPYETQTFEYVGDPVHTEMNYGKVQTGLWLNITMAMRPEVRETHTYGVNYTFVGGGAQAWHFAGTMAHNNVLQIRRSDGTYETNLYAGDAGGLMTPFNCHTSMPAVAVGILAAQSAIGRLSLEPLVTNSTISELVKSIFDRAKWPVHCYIVSIFVALIGVWAHGTATSIGRVVHYLFMPLSFTLMAIPTFYLRFDDVPSVASDDHRTVGYVTLTLMFFQVLYGIYLWLKYGQSSTIFKWFHRIFGYALLVLICGQTWLSKRGVEMYHQGLELYYVVSGAYSGLLIAVLVLALHIIFYHAITNKLVIRYEILQQFYF